MSKAANNNINQSLLKTIKRKKTQEKIYGWDIIRSYDMSWINKEGKTEVRTATIVFSKDSENIIELYSLQKYLSQLHFSSFRSQKDVEHIIKCDLSRLIDHPVKVTCYEPEKYWPTLNWNGFFT